MAQAALYCGMDVHHRRLPPAAGTTGGPGRRPAELLDQVELPSAVLAQMEANGIRIDTDYLGSSRELKATSSA